MFQNKSLIILAALSNGVDALRQVDDGRARRVGSLLDYYERLSKNAQQNERKIAKGPERENNVGSTFQSLFPLPGTNVEQKPAVTNVIEGSVEEQQDRSRGGSQPDLSMIEEVEGEEQKGEGIPDLEPISTEASSSEDSEEEAQESSSSKEPEEDFEALWKSLCAPLEQEEEEPESLQDEASNRPSVTSVQKEEPEDDFVALYESLCRPLDQEEEFDNLLGELVKEFPDENPEDWEQLKQVLGHEQVMKLMKGQQEAMRGFKAFKEEATKVKQEKKEAAPVEKAAEVNSEKEEVSSFKSLRNRFGLGSRKKNNKKAAQGNPVQEIISKNQEAAPKKTLLSNIFPTSFAWSSRNKNKNNKKTAKQAKEQATVSPISSSPEAVVPVEETPVDTNVTPDAQQPTWRQRLMLFGDIRFWF